MALVDASFIKHPHDLTLPLRRFLVDTSFSPPQ